MPILKRNGKTFSGTPTKVDTAKSYTTFDSADDKNPTTWSDVELLTSKEEQRSLFSKISTMFKNIRYLYKILGTTDISAIGDGTLTGGLDALNSNLNLIESVEFIPSFSARKLGHTLEIYKQLSDLGNDIYIRLGITQYKSVNDYTIIPLYSTSPPYLVVGSLWISSAGVVEVFKQSETTECYIFGNYIFK